MHMHMHMHMHIHMHTQTIVISYHDYSSDSVDHEATSEGEEMDHQLLVKFTNHILQNTQGETLLEGAVKDETQVEFPEVIIN